MSHTLKHIRTASHKPHNLCCRLMSRQKSRTMQPKWERNNNSHRIAICMTVLPIVPEHCQYADWRCRRSGGSGDGPACCRGRYRAARIRGAAPSHAGCGPSPPAADAPPAATSFSQVRYFNYLWKTHKNKLVCVASTRQNGLFVTQRVASESHFDHG